MALSIANVIAWDFTSASTPLASKTGQAETFSTNGSPTQSAAGYDLNGANKRLFLNCTNGGDLTNWVYPFTFIHVVQIDNTAANTYMSAGIRRTASGNSGSDLAGMTINSFGEDVGIRNNTGVTTSAWTSMPNATEVTLIHTIRAASTQLWSSSGGAAFTSRTTWTTGQPYTMPTLNTTDAIVIGSRDGNNSKLLTKAFALVPGELISQDFTDLAADWNAALFGGGGGGPSAGALRYYRNLCGISPVGYP